MERLYVKAEDGQNSSSSNIVAVVVVAIVMVVTVVVKLLPVMWTSESVCWTY